MWGWYNINLCVWGCFVWSDGVGGRSLAVLGLLLCVVDAGLLLCLGVAFLVCLFCAYGYVRMFGGFSRGFLVWVGAVVCFCVLRVGCLRCALVAGIGVLTVYREFCGRLVVWCLRFGVFCVF